MLDFASDISRFSTRARKKGHLAYNCRSSSTGAASSPPPRRATQGRCTASASTRRPRDRPERQPAPRPFRRVAPRAASRSRATQARRAAWERRNRGAARDRPRRSAGSTRAPLSRSRRSCPARPGRLLDDAVRERRQQRRRDRRFEVRRASPGSPYLNAIVSPCSVSLSRPSTAWAAAQDRGVSRPPPRPRSLRGRGTP